METKTDLIRQLTPFFVLRTEFAGMDRALFYAYDAAGDIDISAGWTDITLDTEVEESIEFTHAADSAEITIDTTGTYEVTYYITTYVSVGSSQSESRAKMQVDTGGGYTDIPGTLATMLNRDTSQGETNASVTFIKDFTAADKIKLIAQRESGTNTILTLANGCGIVIRDALASGARGPAGAGSVADAEYVVMSLNAELSDERVLTAGDSISVTDGGAGSTATIALTTPGTLTVATANNAADPHLHTITSSSNPGAAASLLASDASGYLQLVGLGIGVAPGSADLHFATGVGITHVDGIAAGQFLRANGTRYVPDTLDMADITDLAYAAPALTFSTSNVEGSADTVMRTDATLAIFDATVPDIIQCDDAAATGAAAFAARRDHTHGIVCAAPGANLTVSTTNAEGSATSFARSDHSHAVTSSSNPGAAASILASDASGYLQLEGLGIGAAPLSTKPFRVENAALNTASTYQAVTINVTKTAGASDAGDALWGLRLDMDFNQVGGTIGALRGAAISADCYNGDVAGFHYGLDVDVAVGAGGSVGNDLIGIHSYVQAAVGATVTGDIVGLGITVDDNAGAAGMVYGLLIEEQTGVDFGFYQDGVADNYFGGNVGLGTATPGAYHDNADNLVVYETGGLAGITIVTDTDSYGSLYFGDGVGAASYRGAVQYDHTNDTLRLWSNARGGSPEITLDNGNVGIGGNLVLPKTSGNGIKVDNTTPTFGWRDLRAEIRTRGVGGTDPNDTTYIGNVKAYSFSVTDEAWIEFHIPHDYVPGTDIFLHFHWSHNSANVTGGSITIGADVTYAKGHDQAAFSATVNPTISPNASTTQYQHMVSELQLSAGTPGAAQIDTDDLEPDGLILARVYLSANNITSDDGVPDPFIHEVDVHYQSTNIATKQNAPDFYT